MATMIRFSGDYDTITKDKMYPVHKRYEIDDCEFLCFNDDISEEIQLKQLINAPPSEMFEIIEVEDETGQV